jgi:hypothetical protein
MHLSLLIMSLHSVPEHGKATPPEIEQDKRPDNP